MSIFIIIMLAFVVITLLAAFQELYDKVKDLEKHVYRLEEVKYEHMGEN